MQLILCIAAAVFFAVEAIWHKSFVAAGFCLLTIALFVI